MRTVKIFMLAAILGWSFSTMQVVGNDTGLAQTPTGSIIVSNNVFTPNGVEGDEKIFEVKSSNNDDVVTLKVFNRFGVLVFSAEDKVCRWNGRSSDGQKLDKGVYIFRAEVVGALPTILMLGDITLLDNEK